MSDLAPIQAKPEDSARLLHDAARRRAVAVDDLLLPETLRLSERDRLVARALFDRLVCAIEDELRATIADQFTAHEVLHAALASAHVAIAGPILDGSAALEEAALVSLLLRRAEEHRIYLAAAGRNDRLQLLIADRDPDIAAEAVAVLVARSRRLDRFEEPVLARTELTAELQHRLVWTVAAALRNYLVDRHRVEPAAADAALGKAANDLLSGYDEGDGLEARCGRLARRLAAVGRLDGALIAEFLGDGTLPLFLAGLSAETGIAYGATWDILDDPARRGPVLLMRAAGLDRQQAGGCLLLLSRRPEDELLIEQIELFDTLSAAEAIDGLSLWALDPAYREALLQLSTFRSAR